MSYDWDAVDQLAGVDDGTSSVGYSYDGLGRRSERTVGTTTLTAHYGDLGDAPIVDTGSSGVERGWIQGPAGAAATAVVPMGLVEQMSSAGVSFPLTEAHGDVSTVTDDLGAVGSRQEYDPWGDQLAGPALDMGWLGAYQRRSDAATGFGGTSGLVQMGVRSYAPGLGSFLSEDPEGGWIGQGATSNHYGYVIGDPVNRHDLRGEDACEYLPVCTIVAPTPPPPEITHAAADLLSPFADLQQSLIDTGRDVACTLGAGPPFPLNPNPLPHMLANAACRESPSLGIDQHCTGVAGAFVSGLFCDPDVRRFLGRAGEGCVESLAAYYGVAWELALLPGIGELGAGLACLGGGGYNGAFNDLMLPPYDPVALP